MTHSRTAAAGSRNPHLTPRQREVLDLLAKGRSNPEIADTLGVSLDGAKWHVREIMGELDVPTREDAAEWWREYNGLPARFRRFAGGILGVGSFRWIAGAAAAGGVIGGAAVLVALISITGDSDPSVSGTGDLASVTSTTTAGTSPTPVVTAAPTWVPVRTAGVHPVGTRSGDAIVDAVISAVESSDGPAFHAMLAPEPIGCIAAQYARWPECPAGEAEGSLVDSVYNFACEAGWNPVGVFDGRADETFRARYALHSVVQGGPGIGRSGDSQNMVFPRAWALFLTDQPNWPAGFAVAVSEGGVMGWGLNCGADVDVFISKSTGNGAFLVPPK